MVHLRLSDPSYELERTISYLNLTIYLERLQMNISNRYCEKRKHHFIFNQRNLLNSLFTRLYFYIQMLKKKQAFKPLFAIRLSREIDIATFYFLIFQYKFEVKTAFLYQYILKLFTFECGCLVGLHIKEGKRQKR